MNAKLKFKNMPGWW